MPKVLVLCEMQSASSRIWTRVTVSISYDDNHNTTGMISVVTSGNTRSVTVIIMPNGHGDLISNSWMWLFASHEAPISLGMMMVIIIIISCRQHGYPWPLSLLLPIVHRFWLVLRAISHILTELLYVSSSWSLCFTSVMYGGP